MVMRLPYVVPRVEIARGACARRRTAAEPAQRGPILQELDLTERALFVLSVDHDDPVATQKRVVTVDSSTEH